MGTYTIDSKQTSSYSSLVSLSERFLVFEVSKIFESVFTMSFEASVENPAFSNCDSKDAVEDARDDDWSLVV